jgi:hypothetical protein
MMMSDYSYMAEKLFQYQESVMSMKVLHGSSTERWRGDRDAALFKMRYIDPINHLNLGPQPKRENK